MAWFKSIQDIHTGMLQKGAALSLQVDVTATPKHNMVRFSCRPSRLSAGGSHITKCREASCTADAPSRAETVERQSAKFTEKYTRLHSSWRDRVAKAYAEHEKDGQEGDFVC